VRCARLIRRALGGALLGAALLAAATAAQLAPLPEVLAPGGAGLRKPQVRDRGGAPLTVTYHNDWNYHDRLELHAIPMLLQQALVTSEDRRFWEHRGVDWPGRLHAAWQNLKAGAVVRGASTLSEQVVRMLTPRPRTLWSRWLEGWDAGRLEARFGKAAVLAFYLNQVPYGDRRRGVVQAARHYFGRDLATLSEAETLALAVVVRAPAHLDPARHPARLAARVLQLGGRLHAAGLLDDAQLAALEQPLPRPAEGDRVVQAEQFVAWVEAQNPGPPPERLETTLDGALQEQVQALLETRLADLAARQVSAGAVLVADHQRGEILAWVNGRSAATRGRDAAIDAVRTPRQPGSALKPFVYALALEDGWSAATLLDDAPLASPVGAGEHPFHNYSRSHYGPLRLRDCLGNSLNIPAVLAARQVGVPRLLALLRKGGFESLARDADVYGLGLALGNGEVTLLELVTGYAALARGGLYLPLRGLRHAPGEAARRLVSPESAALIADILADPDARLLEFGRSSVLNLPYPVAVKTGTSTDYRDAWAVGFDHRYVVGVWLGNLDRTPMLNVTGAGGPALVLRGVFGELARWEEPRPLPRSPTLRQVTICRTSGRCAGAACPSRPEWFRPGRLPGPCELDHGAGAAEARPRAPVAPAEAFRLLQPSDGLHLARDPRIPDALERYPLRLPEGLAPQRTEWLIDGRVVGTTGPGESRWLWPLEPGPHVAAARVWLAHGEERRSAESAFVVRGR